MNLDELVTKINLLLDPCCSNQARVEAFNITEKYKTENFKYEHLKFLCSPCQNSTTIIFGLRCFEYKIKHSWSKCDVNSKKEIKDLLFDVLSFYQKLAKNFNEAAVICSILSQICVFLIKCEWPQQWPNMLDELFNVGSLDILQAKVIIAVFQRLVEDVIDFKELPMERKKTITSSLKENLVPIVNYLLKILDSYSSSNKSKELISLANDALLLVAELFHYFPLEPILNSDCVRIIDVLLDFLNEPNVCQSALECFQIYFHNNCEMTVTHTLDSRLRDSSKKNILRDYFFNHRLNIFNRFISLFHREIQSIEYTPEKKNILVKYSAVFAKLSIIVLEQEKLFEMQPLKCSCSDSISINSSCLNWTSHLFMAVTACSLYPIHQIYVANIDFWNSLFKSNNKPVIDYFEEVVSKIYHNWKKIMYRSNLSTSIQMKWYESDSENDNLGLKWLNIRQIVLKKGFESLSMLYPQKTIENIILNLKETLSNDNFQFSPADFVKPGYPYLVETNYILNEWESLANIFPGVVSSVFSLQDQVTSGDQARVSSLKNGSSEAHFSTQANFNSRAIIFSKCEHEIANFLNETIIFAKKHQQTILQDPRIRQYILTCMVCMLEYAGQQFDKQFLIPVLEEVFISLTHKSAAFPNNKQLKVNLDVNDPIVANMIRWGNRPKCILELQLKASSLLLSFVRSYPSRILSYYEPLSMEITKFWADDEVCLMPKCILLEVMINLCLRRDEDLNAKNATLQNIFNSVLGNWYQSGSYPNIHEINTCEDLIKLMGLHLSTDITQENLSSHIKAMEFRIKFGQSVETLSAIARQLDFSLINKERDKIASGLLDPLLFPLVKMIKLMNEIHDQSYRHHIHETVKAVFDIPNYLKCQLMGIPCDTEEDDNDDDNGKKEDYTPFFGRGVEIITVKKLRSYISNIHEKLLTTFSHFIPCISDKFYSLPLEHIQAILLTGCLASYDQIPLYRFNLVLRKCLQVFAQRCPKEKVETVLIPVLPSLIDASLEYTDSIWKSINRQVEDQSDHDYLSDEVFKEHMVRVLGRSVMIFIRYCYEIYDHSTGSSTAKNGFDEEESNVENNTKNHHNSIPYSKNESVSTFLEQWVLKKDKNETLFWKILADSLGKALAWSDGQTTLKVINALKITLHCLLKTKSLDNASTNEQVLPIAIALHLISNILVALQTNSHMTETHFFASVAGIFLQIYNLTSRTDAETQIRPMILAAISNFMTDTSQRDVISERILTFENKVYNMPNETDKTRVEIFKKIISNLVGTPLCEKFKEHVNIPILPKMYTPASMAAVNRNRKSEDFSNLACLSSLFNN